MDTTMAVLLASLELQKYTDPATCQALGARFTTRGWVVVLSNGKRQMGAAATKFDGRTQTVVRQELRLSKHLIRLNAEDEVLDTIRHEIAHILSDASLHEWTACIACKRAGGSMVHGYAWQAMARKVGARPEATSKTANMPEPAWLLVCPVCGRTLARRHKRAMKLHGRACRRCGRESLGRLQWRRNPEAV